MIRQANGLVYAVDQAALAGQASATPEPGPGDGLPLVCGAGDLVRAGRASLELHDCGDAALDNAVSALWTATANLSRKTGAAGNAAQAATFAGHGPLPLRSPSWPRQPPAPTTTPTAGPWAPPSLLEAPQRARDLAVRENEALWLRWAEAADAAVDGQQPRAQGGGDRAGRGRPCRGRPPGCSCWPATGSPRRR